MSKEHQDIPTHTFEDFAKYGSYKVWCEDNNEYVDMHHEMCLHELETMIIAELDKHLIIRNGTYVTNTSPGTLAKLIIRLVREDAESKEA